MGRLIDADEFEKRIKPYDTEDSMDKALYNFAHETLMMTSTAQPEPTDEQVKEYCKKRCMCLVTYEFIERMRMQYDIPSIECHHCKNWDESWIPSYSDGTSHYCPMIDLVTDEHFYCKYGEFKDGVIH